MDRDGNFLWIMAIGPNGSYYYDLESIQPTDNGGYFVVGSQRGLYHSVGIILKFDSSGNLIGSMAFPRIRSFTNIQRTKRGDYIIIGRDDNYNSNYGSIILRINSSGAIQWSKKSTISLPPQPTDDNGIVAVTGGSEIVKLDQSGECGECPYLEDVPLGKDEHKYFPEVFIPRDIRVKHIQYSSPNTPSLSLSTIPINIQVNKLCSTNEESQDTTYIDTPFMISSTGNVGIGTDNPGSYKLYVNGPAFTTGGWQSLDIRLKYILTQNLTSRVKNIYKLTPFEFEWKTNQYLNKGLPEGKHFGLSAQEVEKYLPELVKEDNEGYKAIAYIEFIPLLLEGMKQQQAEIQRLHMIIEKQEKKIDKLMKRRKSCHISSP